jgi:glycerol transport system substrate-binding protein
VQGEIGPKLNEEESAEVWFEKAKAEGGLAPQPKIENEKEQPMTVSYDELIKSWEDANAAKN